jgi:AMMECR1 domain-containing protein
VARAPAHERILSGKKQEIPLALGRALSTRERKDLEAQLRALLVWQRDLARWPAQRAAPRAIPFVSIYARGRLTGCMGSAEGTPGERLSRAFVSALGDARFGGPMPDDRATLSTQVAYVRDVVSVSSKDVEAALEAGTHGVGVMKDRSAPVMLLPQVARDDRLDAGMMMKALGQKSGADVTAVDARLFLFETDVVAARLDGKSFKKQKAADAAAAWLARLVRKDGMVEFAIDPRRGIHHETGAMHHGRAAVVVQALATHRRHANEVQRARRWLQREIARALSRASSAVASWPETHGGVAGTLALAVRAGVEVERELVAYASANEPAIAKEPWHAAQVVAALGPRASSALWAACIGDLERKSWAPWTALAARARNDGAVLARTGAALVASIRDRGPHEGGANVTAIPETALTAIAIEALDAVGGARARRAADRGRAFLARWQLTPETMPAPLSIDLGAGAFPASPVLDALRGDIVAHALLAIARRA